jgi:hypothetical protein
MIVPDVNAISILWWTLAGNVKIPSQQIMQPAELVCCSRQYVRFAIFKCQRTPANDVRAHAPAIMKIM